ncbi:MAG TPA: hypothetical protein PKE63_00565 [Lacibacter sp.]|nr:hypothetical protein [Lacibacter sp.]HMO90109.1 hypothetical protein [Lacibacter sp.]HMP85734.1 hypothetical protein [Lacibacter sp.]
MRLNNLYDYHPYRLDLKQRQFLRRWEQRRQLRRWKYILYYGILREGIIFFAIIKSFQFLYDPLSFLDLYSSIGGIVFLFFEILFWIIGGYAIGWFKYSTFETEYEMLKSMEHF